MNDQKAHTSREELVDKSKSIAKSLLELKSEHSLRIDSLAIKLATAACATASNDALADELAILERSRRVVLDGIAEAADLVQTHKYVSTVEAERHKYKLQVITLHKEKDWLYDELKRAQKQLRQEVQRVAQLEIEVSHLKYLNELKKFDDANDPEPENKTVDADTIQKQLQLNATEVVTKVSSAKRDDDNALLETRLNTMEELVKHYVGQSKYEIAGPLCHYLIAEQKKAYGVDAHPHMATAFSHLALIYKQQGKRQEAEEAMRNVLAIQENDATVECTQLITTINNLAVLLVQGNHFAEAETLWRRALALEEESTLDDPCQTSIAQKLINLAVLAERRGTFGEVGQLCERAIAIYAAHFDELNVAKAKNRMALCCQRQRKHGEAEKLYMEVLRTAAASHSSSVAIQNDTNEQNEKNCADRETSKIDSSTLITTLARLASVYHNQGRRELAEKIDASLVRIKKEPSVAIVLVKNLVQDRSTSEWHSNAVKQQHIDMQTV